MTPRELAAAIRKGHTMIGETRNQFLLKGCGCALGAALVGSGHSEDVYWEHRLQGDLLSGAERASAKLLGISVGFAAAISRKHSGGIPRLAIADWLDTLDVAKPADAQTFERFMQTALVPVDIETVAAK